MPDDFAVIRRALDELPAACRYHGDRLDGDGPWRDACCDTGRPSKLRRDAVAALDRARAREQQHAEVDAQRDRAERALAAVDAALQRADLGPALAAAHDALAEWKGER